MAPRTRPGFRVCARAMGCAARVCGWWLAGQPGGDALDLGCAPACAAFGGVAGVVQVCGYGAVAGSGGAHGGDLRAYCLLGWFVCELAVLGALAVGGGSVGVSAGAVLGCAAAA